MPTRSITLTEAGLAAGPGFGLGPVGLLFQYLKLLKQTGGGAQGGAAWHLLAPAHPQGGGGGAGAAWHLALWHRACACVHHAPNLALPMQPLVLCDVIFCLCAAPPAGPQEWAWDELRGISDMKFRWAAAPQLHEPSFLGSAWHTHLQCALAGGAPASSCSRP